MHDCIIAELTSIIELFLVLLYAYVGILCLSKTMKHSCCQDLPARRLACGVIVFECIVVLVPRV